MQISRNSEHYASNEPQGFSYHGYSNSLVFYILNRAECLSSPRDRARLSVPGRGQDGLQLGVRPVQRSQTWRPSPHRLKADGLDTWEHCAQAVLYIKISYLFM